MKGHCARDQTGLHCVYRQPKLSVKYQPSSPASSHICLIQELLASAVAISAVSQPTTYGITHVAKSSKALLEGKSSVIARPLYAKLPQWLAPSGGAVLAWQASRPRILTPMSPAHVPTPMAPRPCPQRQYPPPMSPPPTSPCHPCLHTTYQKLWSSKQWTLHCSIFSAIFCQSTDHHTANN